MDKKLSEKIYFSLVAVDFDYIAVRHLMAGAIFPSAGTLANMVIDRYIKTFLWSEDRDDLVQKIRKWKGSNGSHDIVGMIDLVKKELKLELELSDTELEVLKNIFKCYCFRYVDNLFQTQGMCEIRMNYIHTIDKVCSFFRERIKLISPHHGNTIIDILLGGNEKGIAALSTGNVNLRDILLTDNPYSKNLCWK